MSSPFMSTTSLTTPKPPVTSVATNAGLLEMRDLKRFGSLKKSLSNYLLEHVL